MQSVLALAPLLTLVPAGGADSPPLPEGGFLASYEAELPLAEGPVLPPVMLVVLAPPEMVPRVIAAAVEGDGWVEVAGGGDAPLSAVSVDAVTVGADGADLVPAGLASGTGVGIPQPEPGAVSDPWGSPHSAERKDDPAPRGDGRAEGPVSRSVVAETTWGKVEAGGAMTSSTSSAHGAVAQRVEGPGRASFGPVEGPDLVDPRSPEPVTARAGREMGPDVPSAIALTEAGRETAMSLLMEAGRRTAMPETGPRIAAPAAPAPGGILALEPLEPVTAVNVLPGARPEAVRDPSSFGDGTGVPALLPLPAVPDDLGLVPETDERPALDRSAPTARAGLWESLFSGLALPLASVGEALSLRPGPTAGTEAVLLGGKVGLPTARLVAEQPTPPLTLTAGSLPASATVGAASPASPPAVAFWTEWTQLTPMQDAADEDGAGLPAGPASTPMTTSALPVGPASSSAMPSSPVPHVAAQITAALSQGADGATELALSPEELGRVHLRLEPDAANPDRMVVMITFERPETLDLFRRHAGELADAFRAAGYAGADIGFGQDRSGSGSPSDAEGRSADGRPGQGQHDPAAPASPAPPPSAPRLVAGASLDLRL